jgi:hypothetical protein
MKLTNAIVRDNEDGPNKPPIVTNRFVHPP